MKNLKKVLALVLAFACAFTMFAGAASYSDKADIKATTAVDMLSSLGVIQGYEDGSFKPNTTVTRAQMAKMIFTIMNGGNDNANAYTSLPTKFTDLPTAAWAQGYVRYLQNTGIIAGKSVTKFAPNDTVTGLEAAKMVLVAAGYNAQKAGLTGAAWAQNTMKYGQLNNLFEDVDADLNAALPRQYAAQILYNALDMKRVVWSNDINDFKNATDVSGEETIGEKYMDLYKTTAAVLTSVKKTDGKDTYKIELASGVNYAKVTGKEEFTKVPTDVSDLLGLKVKVLVKVKNNGDEDVYGVYADDDSKVIATGTVGQLESVSSDSMKTKLNGTEYKLDKANNALKVIYANKGVSTDTVATIEKQTTGDKVTGTVKLVDTNGNNKVDTVVVTPAVASQITYAGSSKVTVRGFDSEDIEDVDIYDGFAKDDWVVRTAGTYTSSDDTAVAKIDVTTSKVTSFKSAKTGSPAEVKIGDAWYKIVTDYKYDDTQSVKTGSTYDFAIVGNYVVNAKETEASSNDILLVTDFEDASGLKSSSTQKVKAYFLDGSSKTITVEKLFTNASKDTQDVNSKNAINKDSVNKLYTYSVRSNGNYSLKALGSSNKAGYETAKNLDNGKITDKNKIDGYSINDSAVVFALYDTADANNNVKDTVKVLTGKTVNDWSNEYGSQVAYATKKTNGVETVRVAVVIGDSKYSGAGSDYKYAYMTSDSYAGSKDNEDNDDITVYEAWTGSENATLKVDDNNGAKKSAGDILIYTDDGVNFINVETASDVDVVKVAITGIDKVKEGDVVVRFAGGKDTYSMDKDCVYIAVNDDKQEGMEGGLDGIQLAEEHTSGKYFANAKIVLEYNKSTGKYGDVLAIIYDADNNHLAGNSLF